MLINQNLKKTLFFVVLGSILAILLFNYWNNNSSWFSSIKIRKNFLWGATIRPYALMNDNNRDKYDPKRAIDLQIQYLKELGGNTIRANMELDDSINDYIVESAQKNHLQLIIILEDLSKKREFNLEDNYYQKGYEFAKKYAQHYKGKVAYYQMLNEVTGLTVQTVEDKGPTLDNRYDLRYNKNRYENVKKYLQGMSKAINESDTKVRKMISGNWILIDIIKYYIDNDIDFDTVGWNWSDEMGSDISDKKIDGKKDFNLAKTINDWGKELIVVELYKSGGSYQNKEQEQKDYFHQFLNNTNNFKLNKGIMIFTLTDSFDIGSDGFIGIMGIHRDQKEIDKMLYKKPVFDELKEFIKNNS